MEHKRLVATTAITTDENVQPGGIRFHVIQIEPTSVSQAFVDRLRAIGADTEAVDFAQRQVPPVNDEAGAPEASA
jgi:hypothetical protein